MKRKQKNYMWKSIRHDLRCGVIGQWPKYLLLVLLLLWLGARQAQGLASTQAVTEENIVAVASTGDFLANFMRGMDWVAGAGTRLNIMWIVINMMLAFIVSFYPFKDMHGYGQQMLLRTHDRVSWWLSKCVWNMACVLVFYLLIYLCAVVSVMFIGDGPRMSLIPYVGRGGMTVHTDKQNWFMHDGIIYCKDIPYAVMRLLLIPFIVSWAISMLQMLVSLFFKPVAGIVCTSAVLASSIFSYSSYALGNHLQMLRARALTPEPPLVISAVLIVTTIVAGALYFRKKDLLSS